MQFQVPQFIDTEDKIVGPFTMRQFTYIGAAGGFSFILYFTLQTFLWAIFSLLLVAAALALAFLKLEGRPLTHVILSAFNFYWKPQTYVWQPEHPEIQKSEASLRPIKASGISLESIISGLALRNAWESLQTGKQHSDRRIPDKTRERYQILRRRTGERSVARRVDYR